MDLNIHNMNKESLAQMESDQLITIVLNLFEANEKLKQSSDDTISKAYDLRLEQLEREVNKFKQHSRRDTIEIAGIKQEVADEQIEEECLKILKAAKVKVANKFPASLDIQAAHRKGRKGNVIVKFVNRKFAYTAVSNSRNLKDFDDGDLYINTSLCPEFGFLNYAVRRAKKNQEILSYKMKNGVTFIQMSQNGQMMEISHVNDLTRNGITVPNRSF